MNAINARVVPAHLFSTSAEITNATARRFAKRQARRTERARLKMDLLQEIHHGPGMEVLDNLRIHQMRGTRIYQDLMRRVELMATATGLKQVTVSDPALIEDLGNGTEIFGEVDGHRRRIAYVAA